MLKSGSLAFGCSVWVLEEEVLKDMLASKPQLDPALDQEPSL